MARMTVSVVINGSHIYSVCIVHVTDMEVLTLLSVCIRAEGLLIS